MSIAQALPVDEGERRGQAERARVGDALGGADDEVAAGAQRVGEPRVQRVADLLGEVDDGVAAEHEVVGAGRHGACAAGRRRSKRDHAPQLGLGAPAAAVGRLEVARRARWAARRGRPRR